MGLGVLADGEAVHKPFPKVIPVVRQNGLQRVVQKTQILLQFTEIAFGNGSIPLLIYTEAILAQIEVVVLTELLGVCVVGGGLLIRPGVVFFLHLPGPAFTRRPPEALILQPLDGGL